MNLSLAKLNTPLYHILSDPGNAHFKQKGSFEGEAATEKGMYCSDMHFCRPELCNPAPFGPQNTKPEISTESYTILL